MSSARDPAPPTETSWLARLRSRLGKTRAGLTDGLATLFLGRKALDAELLEELETRLLLADVGIEATQTIIERLGERVSRRQLSDGAALMAALRDEMCALLAPVAVPLVPDPARRPFVLLMVGINGAGKTTTIGKLAQRFLSEGRSVMLAAGDTFRAAAVDQLQVWGERNGVPVIAQPSGADAASVIFDAMTAARARATEVLIADTAGRLHTQHNLMEELRKIKRVMGKADASAPHETLLVLDAGTGQNALAQAVQFHEAIGLTGLVLTKLDGTAKGGIVFAIARRLGLPIRYIGVGEGLDDLRPFEAATFVDALLGDTGHA
ncbi:signal recognition particle-docking protein FtsY [Plasticicumulans lactativorans]|uniref:Signal recognition particle receptor FtsY n=1 Tax=Plasticicumulans lactativorans TaxID=1133106 RepID=A0A4R2LB03_9GAMM|nr:signal recognition particle-docking protein FtsY [Plasticicumulans lactativorans]TCO81436.1 signal recognition particle-docking protein FtsY [Plasticicumulans lactativorans]